MASPQASKHFQQLVESGRPVGEVTSVEQFLIRIKGLQPVSIHALILFDNGSKGFVYHIYEDHVVVLHLGEVTLKPGMLATVQYDDLVTKVGKDFIGRVVSVSGEPLDGKGAIAADAVWPGWRAFCGQPNVIHQPLGQILCFILWFFPCAHACLPFPDSSPPRSVRARGRANRYPPRRIPL